MKIQFKDYNNSDAVIAQNYSQEWREISTVLQNMPLHLKASDQKGKQGTPIFNPVGTNQHIKDQLIAQRWLDAIPLPPELDALGTGVDFGKRGLLLEVQFSNYPFLLNNLLRSEILYKRHFSIGEVPTRLALIVTKAHMFPSSNSSLYYEQAVKQLDLISSFDIFEIPLRIIGLFENYNEQIPTTWNVYSNSRYSRTVNDTNVIKSVINDRNVIRIVE